MGGPAGYAVNVDANTFATNDRKNSSAASSDIARLNGQRLAVSSEFPKSMLLNVAALKNYVGGDKVTARHLYQNEIEFVPAFKLFLNTNYLPAVVDDTIFTSGRVNVITFDRHFTPEEQDKGLKESLRTQENLSGILNWMLEGLQDYYEKGLATPQTVIDATRRYQEESDRIAEFMSDCLIESDEIIKCKDVFDRYKDWTARSGYKCEGKKKFYAELRGKNLLYDQGTINGFTVDNVMKGYSIIKDDDEDKNTESKRLSRISKCEADKYMAMIGNPPTGDDSEDIFGN